MAGAGAGDGDAVVAVLDEVQVADAVDADRRDCHAAPLREIEPLRPERYEGCELWRVPA